MKSFEIFINKNFYYIFVSFKKSKELLKMASVIQQIIVVYQLLYIVILFITGLFLLVRMHKTKLYNLAGLVAFFLLFPMQLLGQFLFPFMIYAIITGTGYIFLLFFIQNTFYRESNFPFLIILIIMVILRILDFFIRLTYEFTIPESSILEAGTLPIYYTFMTIVALETMISFLWLARAAYITHKKIKNEDIEPWIKNRYVFIEISSLIFAISGFVLIFWPSSTLGLTPTGTTINLVYTLFIGNVLILFAITSLIGWVMPSKLKVYFNKNYEPLEDKEYTEGEIIAILNYLSDFLANKLDLSTTAVRGMIKLAVHEEFSPIEHDKPLNYGNLKSVIQNPLKERIEKLKDQQHLDVETIDVLINETLSQLNKGQSLITMSNI